MPLALPPHPSHEGCWSQGSGSQALALASSDSPIQLSPNTLLAHAQLPIHLDLSRLSTHGLPPGHVSRRRALSQHLLWCKTEPTTSSSPILESLSPFLSFHFISQFFLESMPFLSIPGPSHLPWSTQRAPTCSHAFRVSVLQPILRTAAGMTF